MRKIILITWGLVFTLVLVACGEKTKPDILRIELKWPSQISQNSNIKHTYLESVDVIIVSISTEHEVLRWYLPSQVRQLIALPGLEENIKKFKMGEFRVEVWRRDEFGQRESFPDLVGQMPVQALKGHVTLLLSDT